MRFILNLKKLNLCIFPPHFKLENWRMVICLILSGSQMVSLDLEDAYLLVLIHPEHRKFLRFQWRGKTFQFSALSFGLATTLYIFTKLLRSVVASLWVQSHESVLYLNDFLLLIPSKVACVLTSKLTSIFSPHWVLSISANRNLCTSASIWALSLILLSIPLSFRYSLGIIFIRSCLAYQENFIARFKTSRAWLALLCQYAQRFNTAFFILRSSREWNFLPWRNCWIISQQKWTFPPHLTRIFTGGFRLYRISIRRMWFIQAFILWKFF